MTVLFAGGRPERTLYGAAPVAALERAFGPWLDERGEGRRQGLTAREERVLA